VTDFPVLVRSAYGDNDGNNTTRKQSALDFKSYLLPRARVHAANLYLAGVATGLVVTPNADITKLTVSPGVAVDAMGNLICLAPNGLAITDTDASPDAADPANVSVNDAGVDVPAPQVTGPRWLSIRWREVAEDIKQKHAPWLLYVDGDPGDVDVVLARVELNNGQIASMTAEGRCAVGLRTDRIELRASVDSAAPNSVDTVTAATLSTLPDGEVNLAMSPPKPDPHFPGPFTPLSIKPNGWLRLGDPGARVRIGAAEGNGKANLQVDNSGIHSGAGVSFADHPAAPIGLQPGESPRWMWYALNGSARLWSSGADRLSVDNSTPDGGVDAHRRLRILQDGPTTPAVWFAKNDQPAGQQARVGMADDDHVGFFGNQGAGWGLTMDVGSGRVEMGGSPDLTQIVPRLYVNLDDSDAPLFPTTAAIACEAVVGNGLSAVSQEGIGLYASGKTFAAKFETDIQVTGTVFKEHSQFKIDHPVTPSEKYLYHGAVESDEMKNVYDGEVVTDVDGTAEVSLPGWFEALNERIRYQLTPIGMPAPNLHVAQEISQGRFRIAGAPPGVKVCWQVSGVRRDAYARAHPLTVEVDKAAHERGRYLHPELHDAPPAMVIRPHNGPRGILASATPAGTHRH
jgi:hypothetical protein